MKITSSEMQNIIIYGSVAKTDQIKSLTDVERKVIKIISDSFREGKASIEVDDTTYSGIKEKLKTEPATRKPTPFLEKMLKVFQNFFSDRISSESLQKEIQNALHTTEPLIQKEIQIIQKQQQRHDQIQSDLKNAQQKLSKLDPQKNQTEINELKGEIRRLYQEKANLDIVQIPKELRSQVEKFTNKMAHICEDVKTDTLTHYYKELQDAIGDQFKENQSNHGELSSQFTKDYVNRNIANFVLVDRDKNIYLENAKIGTSKEEKKETYLKKFNGLFKTKEQNWKTLSQIGLSQLPLTTLVLPMTNKFMFDPENKDFIFDKDNSKINITAEIKRNAEGEITSIQFKADVRTPISHGLVHDEPTEVIGFVESSLSYTITLDKGEPKVTINKLEHHFTDSPVLQSLIKSDKTIEFEKDKKELLTNFQKNLSKYQTLLNVWKTNTLKTQGLLMKKI